MPYESYAQELRLTEQNIRQAQNHIRDERALIQTLREKGRNSQAAEALLHALEVAVSFMEQHRDLVREELVFDRLDPRSEVVRLGGTPKLRRAQAGRHSVV
jgi:hypothetical protein